MNSNTANYGKFRKNLLSLAFERRAGLILFMVTLVFSENFFKSPQPAPFTNNNKILSMVLAYNMNHFESLIHIFDQYVSMCEGGWNPKVVLFISANYTYSVKAEKMIDYKTFCHRLNRTVEIEYKYVNASKNLASYHRNYTAKVIDDFDIFVFQEDDMILTYHNIVSWIYETWKLNSLLINGEMKNYAIGFIRFRRVYLIPSSESLKSYSGKDITNEDIIGTEFIEEEPEIRYSCISDQKYMILSGNTHQSFWIFSKDQIVSLQNRCQFLNHSRLGESGTIEYMTDFSIWDKNPTIANPTGGCGIIKIVPSNIESFLVHHYYPGQRRTRKNKLMYNELRRFKVGNRANKGYIPPCWKNLVNISQTEEKNGI
jgi:hypothetical protein